jgi:phosphohistidine phosphatase
LYLVRHAKSSWDDESLSDFDRPLNKRGKRDAPQMGEHLKRVRLANPNVIITSPALRARDTGGILADVLGYDPARIIWEERIYGGDVSDLLTIIRHIDHDCLEAMLIGHNPGLTNLAEVLSGEKVGNMPTCGVFCMDFNVLGWHLIDCGLGKKVFFDVPKQI